MDSISTWGVIDWILIIGIPSVALGIFLGCFFTIHTKQAGIVERFGKFVRVAGEGLNWKQPWVESVVYVEDLNMQLMDVEVESKTKDDATVKIPVRVQYFVLPDRVKEAYYELDDPEAQIKAHVENTILSAVPKMTLDETYQQEDVIAKGIKEALTAVMQKFGYSIENALVTKIIPSEAVTKAMNEINAARREKVATEARAEASKLMAIAKAEGEKQAQILSGEGVAGEQMAIVAGLKESLKDFEEDIKSVTGDTAMALIMMARYFDALKNMGATSNTILLPHSPSAVQDIYGQLRNAIIAGNLASKQP